MAQSERVRVKGVRKREVSQRDIELLSLAIWLGAKRQLRDRRQQAEKAKARQREIARQREARNER
jgi:hypothetical protein